MRFLQLLAALTICSAYAQGPASRTGDRTYRLTANPAPLVEVLPALANIVRAVTGAGVIPDVAEARITVGGPGEVPEMAEWLLRQLDKAPGTTPSEPAEFHASQSDDNVIVLYLAHSSGRYDVPEFLSILRTVADVRTASIYSALNALVVRGTASQVALVKGLVAALDQDIPITVSEALQFAVGGTPDVVRVYFLTHAKEDDLYRILDALREGRSSMKTSISTAKSAVVVRGTPEQMARASESCSRIEKSGKVGACGKSMAWPVRFWMIWLALVISAFIAWPHRVVVHRVRAGAKLQAIDEDIDLLLCVVPLGLTAILPLLVAPFWLHARPRTFLAVILVFGAVSTALTQWRRRAH